MKKVIHVAAILLPAIVSVLYSVSRETYGEAVVTEIVSVYDGDTFTANIDGWPPIVGREISVRIAGIDCPEKRGSDDYEKELAAKAGKYAEKRLREADTVTLKNIRRGKYFRLLADVYVDRWSLGRELLRVGLAKEYDGGTRPEW